jgi:2-desacetyl-2-hydroxyethyl bacteriochlorophyllide A dehydrogenase
MKAAIIYGPMNLKVEEVPDPACNDDELLIKVHRASICNSTDTHIWDGTFPAEARPPYPHILGHENSGEIVKVGKNLKHEYKVGDRLAWWVKMSGAFAEYNVIAPKSLAVAKIDDNLTYDEGTLLEIVGGVLRCLYDGGLRIGEKVLVLGQGPTGLLFTQLLRLVGASRIYTLDLFENRLKLSSKYGANFIYNLSNKTHSEAFKDLQSKLGQIDAVVDTMGNNLWKDGNTRNLAVFLLKRHGRYIAWGHPTEDAQINIRRISNEDIVLRGFEPGMQKSNDLIKFGAELIANKRLNVSDMITHHFPLDEVEEGLKLCKAHHGEVIKVVLDVN